MNAARSSPKREWLVITVLTLVGAILRCWNFGRLSLSHFDEGIYAFSGLWALSKYGLRDLDPSIVAYAPPGFPILVGLSYVLFGVSDYAAIVVAIVAGIATIPVAGWLGRRTFGPGAGAAAATFAALAMVHVAFSRKALTDAPFLLAWLVAIGVGSRFLERPGFVRALVLGGAVGVAQNVKYNGWLAGAIVVVAALAGAVAHPEERRFGHMLRTLGWGLLAALTAGLVYAPWFRFVETHGGYAALLRHHRGYMHAAGWWATCSTQLGEAFALSGERIVGAITGVLAWFAFRISIKRDAVHRSNRPRGRLRLVLGAAILAFFCSFQAYLPWWIGVGWTPWLLAHRRPAFRLLGAGWLILAVLTPFYTPYARLWLPLHALGWLLMAGVYSMLLPLGWIGSEVTLDEASAPSLFRQRLVLAGIAVACAVNAAIHVTIAQPHAISWSAILKPKDSLREFAFNDVPEKIPRGATIWIHARRPLAFYLALQGRFVIHLRPTPDFPFAVWPRGSWLISDALMLPRSSWYWEPEPDNEHWLEVDPITILDYEPQAAFHEHDRQRKMFVWPDP